MRTTLDENGELVCCNGVGHIYVTKSENHQTNIDAELLDNTISKIYLKRK